MTTANHISQDDLALFALQLLSDEETQEALAHLQHCDQCREEVGEFHGDLALYSMVAEMHTPPAPTRARLLNGIAQDRTIQDRTTQEKQTVPLEVPAAAINSVNGAQPAFAGPRGSVIAMNGHSAARRSRLAAFSWAGWAVAAALAAAAGLEFYQRQQLQNTLNSENARYASLQDSAAQSQGAISALTDPGALNVTLRQPKASGAEAPQTPEGHAAYLPDRGALVFVASNLEPLRPYKVYELWLLPSEKKLSPIPAGSFRPDAAGNATIILPTGPKLLSVKGFGVTQEDDHSAPKQPTLPILLMGTSKT